MSLPGEIAAALTTLFFTFSVLCFEEAGRRIGSLTVNLLRLVLALVFMSLFAWIYRGRLLPLDIGPAGWIWLTLSGGIGFVVGDLFLFKAFVMIGGRISMLVYSLAPIFTSVFGYIFLSECLKPVQIAGIVLALGGVATVILTKPENGKRLSFAFPFRGILFAFIGMLGQAGGFILSKAGMAGTDAVGANQIRLLAGTAGFVLVFFVLKRWGRIKTAFRNKKGILFMSLGAVFGPSIGVTFSLVAVANTNTGIASAIIATVPVLLIFPSIFIYREKIVLKEIFGALVAVAGITLLFLVRV